MGHLCSHIHQAKLSLRAGLPWTRLVQEHYVAIVNGQGFRLDLVEQTEETEPGF